MSEEQSVVEFRPEPSRLGIISTIVCAVAVGFTIAFSSILLAIPIGIVGIAMVSMGVISGNRTPLGIGVGILVFGLLMIGSFFDSPVGLLLIGFLGAILAWDIGENAISLGEQLGREARTFPAEVFHLSSSLLVGALGIALVYAIFSASTGGRPLPALMLLVIGVVYLGWMIRR